MNRRILAILALSGAIIMPAQADRGTDGGIFYDKARVIAVKPLKTLVRVPVTDRECWTDEVERPVHAHRDPSGLIAGTIIGGVVGNQLGRGHRDRGLATVAGTVIGGMIGNSMSRVERHTRIVRERRCRVVNKYYEEERLSGYLVTYRYRGREFTREMDERPGRFVTVRVAVEPLE